MEVSGNKRFVYEFGRFVLDPNEKTLFADGVPVHLPAKEFETLLLLVENNGRALSKDEMIAAVWHDSFVEETNLAKQISKLRKIFNTNGDRFIETLPKHGYRFTADLRLAELEIEGPIILEKRTVKKLTVKLENDFEEPPPLALPPKRSRFWSGGIFAALVLVVGIVAGVVWFWQPQEQTVTSDESGIVFVTDASHDSNGANWVGEGRIYFLKYTTNTRTEAWRMNADGSDQHRANDEIKDLLNGRWSPDARRVVFRKEGDDKTVYLADASGANEIALPFIVGNMDWSPDGLQFVYQSKDSNGKNEIFLYKLAAAKSVQLTDSNVGNADPSFSYDGQQIAFTSFRDGNPEIYLMNADGTGSRRLTDHPAFDNYPVFAPDGTAIAFQSNRENERTEIYLQNLNDDSPPRRISNFSGETGIAPKCWSADGTQILLFTNQNGKDQIVLANVEPYPAKLVLSDETSDLSFPQIFPDGRQILYQARLPDRSIELRLTDLETQTARTIFKTAPGYSLNSQLAPALSPDGRRIAFTDRANGNTEIFIINVDGSGLQNLTRDRLLDANPVFSPDGSEIVFERNNFGKASLYRMSIDGSNQRRFSQKTGYEMEPAFSPDGLSIAFTGDRQNAESRGLDIFLLDFNNPLEEKRLTARRFHDTEPAFSPDGSKIVFVATSDENSEVYLMNADGSGSFRLTRNKSNDTGPQFSADGKSIIFSSDRNGKQAIYELTLPF
jgi:Tol biopolymer transport system component/DNA-binding winged helix-turn-helix (wHTH) protein